LCLNYCLYVFILHGWKRQLVFHLLFNS
jgi:hypothetical protein